MVISKIIDKLPVELVEIELPVKSSALTHYKEEKIHPSLDKAKRILPWEVDSDGFFICKLRKTGDIIFCSV